MQFDDLFDQWEPDDIRLKGRRIGLEDVLDLYESGMTAAEIADYFGTLQSRQIEDVIAYYLLHQAELDPAVNAQRRYAAEQTRQAEQHPSERALRMRALLEARARERSATGSNAQ